MTGHTSRPLVVLSAGERRDAVRVGRARAV